jgi:hypothetical protein
MPHRAKTTKRVYAEWTVRQDWCGEIELAPGYTGETLRQLLADEKAGWSDGKTIVLYGSDGTGNEIIAHIVDANLADDDRELVRVDG